jgi:hypothetical protein
MRDAIEIAVALVVGGACGALWSERRVCARLDVAVYKARRSVLRSASQAVYWHKEAERWKRQFYEVLCRKERA